MLNGHEEADVFGPDAVTFSNLPGSKQEVTSVAGIIPGPAKLLLAAAATEASFKSLPLANYRVIHLAVHGVASPQFPDRVFRHRGGEPGFSELIPLPARQA